MLHCRLPLALALLWLVATPWPGTAAANDGRDLLLPTTFHPVPARRFAAPGKGKRPAVLLLHGRNGLDRFRSHYEDVARAIAASGLDAYLLSYYDDADSREAVQGDAAARQAFFNRRVADWARLVRDCVGDILADGRCSGAVGLVGFSQGGFLATLAAGQDPRIACFVVFYGGIPSLFSDRITRLPPLLELHGDADTVVPLATGKALADRARGLGQTAEMVVFPRAGHGFSGPDAERAKDRTLAFLKKQLLQNKELGQNGQ